MNVRTVNRERMVVAVIEPVCAHGGMDYYDYSLLNGLVNAGIEPRLYTSEAGPLAPEKLFIAETFEGVYGKAPKLYRVARWVLGLRKTMIDAVRHDARIAHFHFFDAGPLERMGIWFARRYGLRAVATIHDVESLHKKRGKANTAAVLTSLDGIIVHSEVSRNEVAGMIGGKGATLTVIPHGNYLAYRGRTLSKEDARCELGLPGDRKIFLFFGQVKKVKGLDIAIKALAILKRKKVDASLLVAGRAWKDDLTLYKDIIRLQHLEGEVVWHTRYIPQDAVDSYYSACDAVVLPYRKIYQSGVLLMAMSYGAPVIVSDLPSMLEIVREGENGVIFRTDDASALAEAMLAIANNPSEAASLGARAQDYVKRFHNWDDIGVAIRVFYDNILGVSPGK